MKSQVVSIQVLRGLAAFLVVIAHVIEHGSRGEKMNAVVLTGRFGVEIFFVISGFVIAFVAGTGRYDPVSFAVRRVLRIAPLYWLCTLLVFGLALGAPSFFKTTVADSWRLLLSLAFLPSPDPHTPLDWRPLFKIGWTLNYEMFFYLIVAFLCWCRSSLQRAIMLSVVLGALIFASFFVERRASVFAFYANLNLLPFICGVWLAELWHIGCFERSKPQILALYFCMAIGCIALLYTLQYEAVFLPLGHLILTMAGVMIVTTGLLFNRYMEQRSLYGLRAIGDASYSLYLTHMFIVGVGWALMHRYGFRGFATVLGGAATVGCAILVSLLSFRYIEQPFIRLGRRLTRRRQHQSATEVGAFPLFGYSASKKL